MAQADAGGLMPSLVGVSVAPLVGLSTKTLATNCARTFMFFHCRSTLASWGAVVLFEIAAELFDLDSPCRAMEGLVQ
jgi:hypothetical protein